MNLHLVILTPYLCVLNFGNLELTGKGRVYVHLQLKVLTVSKITELFLTH